MNIHSIHVHMEDTHMCILKMIDSCVWYVWMKIDVALQEGVCALKLLLSKGLTETARSFNTEQKYKHIKLQTLPIS